MYEKGETNMKNGNRSVEQASRLSELTWKRHLPHYQLSAGYYFITFATHNRVLLRPPQKDCVFNAVCFLDGKKYELYSNMENLVLRARSETEGSASEFCDKIPSGDNQSRVLRARIFT